MSSLLKGRGVNSTFYKRWYDTLIQHGVKSYSWEEAVRDLQLAALFYLSIPVHFHEVFIGAQGRSTALMKVIFSGLFSTALEMEAESILP